MSINNALTWRYCFVLLLALGLSCAPYPAYPESGQYRSKVLLSPAGTIDQGAQLSIEELERQIDSIDQAYAKSSAGLHLARHYVAEGEYAKAEKYYKTALDANGLSDVANREIFRELAQVYLLQENYTAAILVLQEVLDSTLTPVANDYLTLAQAHYKQGQYVQVVAVLDQLRSQLLTLDTRQTHQALALYYRTGAWEQSEKLLQQLLTLEPDNSENWHLLVSVYLQDNKKHAALDRLSLAREKSVTFSERDILLLVQLQGANKNPYGAAELLGTALANKEVAASGENYRLLFQFWFQAREKAKAEQALNKAARLTGDTELYLYLAQLQMDRQDWGSMYKTLQEACTEQLQDRFVSRANLLLGISQLKLEDTGGARRSFINASLVGGAGAQSGQWLRYMNAKPTTPDEARRVVGVCYGSKGKAAVIGVPENSTQDTSHDEHPVATSIEIKTVPPIRFYYTDTGLDISQLTDKLQIMAAKLTMSLIKRGGSSDGKVYLIRGGARSKGDMSNTQIALSVRGLPVAKGRFKLRRSKAYECAYQLYRGPAEGLQAALAQFIENLGDEGYKTGSEVRVIIGMRTGVGAQVEAEFQVNIRQ